MQSLHSGLEGLFFVLVGERRWVSHVLNFRSWRGRWEEGEKEKRSKERREMRARREKRDKERE